MKYKIIGDVNISGNRLGDIIEREPHAVEEYLKRGEVEEVVEEVEDEIVEDAVEEVELSRDQIKAMLKEKGIEFKGNAKTTKLLELLNEEKDSNN